ncbi:MAG: hypothetical protein HC906_19550 [Bacteroidales bacterium]|nr:hypothetical protein [Bacteroidales bacterium]
MDTLLPVIIKPNHYSINNEIWWFTTNEDLFNALPDRYTNLQDTYKELKKTEKKKMVNTIL